MASALFGVPTTYQGITGETVQPLNLRINADENGPSECAGWASQAGVNPPGIDAAYVIVGTQAQLDALKIRDGDGDGIPDLLWLMDMEGDDA